MSLLFIVILIIFFSVGFVAGAKWMKYDLKRRSIVKKRSIGRKK